MTEKKGFTEDKTMDFYFVKFKTEKFSFGKWREDSFGKGNIVVIAENLEEATEKINTCFKACTDEKKRKVLDSDIQRCDGLLHFDDDGAGLSHFWAIK